MNLNTTMIAVDPVLPTKVLLDSCKSTNDIAYELALRGAAHGSYVSTDEQTHGRGRYENSWKSLPGNLFLSIIGRLFIHPRKHKQTQAISKIPMTVSLAIANYIKTTFQCEPLIKWPNDLYFGDKKFAGVLCESHLYPTNPFVIMGLSVNIHTAPESPYATYLLNHIHHHTHLATKEALREPITQEVLNYTELLLESPNTIRQWAHNFAYFHPGDAITWKSPVTGALFSGHVIELTEQFGLRVKIDTTAQASAHYSEDVVELFSEEVEKCRKDAP